MRPNPTQLGATYDDDIAWTVWLTVFFFFVGLIELNMIAGLIVDTFTDLRQDSSNRDILLDNYCLICSKERDEFNERGLDFEEHITTEHNAIHYYYFLAYLKDKMEKDDRKKKNDRICKETILSLNEEFAKDAVYSLLLSPFFLSPFLLSFSFPSFYLLTL